MKDVVEELVVAQITKQAIDRETAQWITKLNDRLTRKLENVGLIEKRASSHLADFIKNYVDGRTDIKPRTRLKFRATSDYLIEFFGATRLLGNISPGDADDWRVFLVGKKMAENTIRKHTQIAKQFFAAAVRRKLIDSNPFSDLRSTVQPNPDRFYFVTRIETDKILSASPNAQWRAIVALCRFGGLRCPSEVLALRWHDVDFANGRVTINSCKTEHHIGGTKRTIPLFPELRPHLEALFDIVRPGIDCPLSTPLITQYRDADQNLRTGLKRIIRRAGLTPWEKLFQNLRSTRQTELADQFPAHVVCAWIGNSKPVAAKHYLQVTDEHFKKAAQKTAQSAPDGNDSDGLGSGDNSKSSGKSTGDKRGQLCATGKIAEEGLEPPTRGL
ncbi:MAG: tyrosine-type recombinase/integrase [Pirellulales bacterium]